MPYVASLMPNRAYGDNRPGPRLCDHRHKTMLAAYRCGMKVERSLKKITGRSFDHSMEITDLDTGWAVNYPAMLRQLRVEQDAKRNNG